MSIRSGRFPGGLIALLVSPAFTANPSGAGAAELELKRLRIESTPSGATVSSIVGELGTTPLSISERDIYPNSYPEDRQSLYGKVMITRDGCTAVTRRVTLDDISGGMDIDLQCEQTVTAEDAETRPEPATAESDAVGAAAPTALSQRRLRQLKVLDELLADGLISEQEERTIRRRILDSLTP
jgi:hypothetical protein